MKYEEQSLWVIPPAGYESQGLEDGKTIFYSKNLGERHYELARRFLKDYHFPQKELTTDLEVAKYLNSLGFCVVFNASQKIEDKYYLGIFLAEQLTEKQISFFEEMKEVFSTYFHRNIAFFNPKVFSTEELSYRSSCLSYRDLKIENIMEGKNPKDGQELLYRELERQKENYNHKKIS